jgi:putative acetyltransferase
MTIREIQPQDNAAIAAVIREVFIADDFPKTGTAFADVQLDFMYEAYDKPRATYLILENDGKIIGGVGISQLENSKDNICELQKMYLLQEGRGKGCGFQMIMKCLEKATGLGYEKCYLETLPEMLTAQHLYKKAGFEYLAAPMGNTGHTTCPIFMIISLNPKIPNSNVT